MGDTHRNARLLRGTKRKDRKRVDVTVDNLPALLFKETLKLSLVFSYMLIGRYLKDPATERFDLITGNKRRIGIDKKIELHFASVNMTIVVHDDCLNAAAKHLAHDLGDANWFSLAHRPVFLFPNLAPKVPVKHFQSMRKQRFRT